MAVRWYERLCEVQRAEHPHWSAEIRTESDVQPRPQYWDTAEGREVVRLVRARQRRNGTHRFKSRPTPKKAAVRHTSVKKRDDDGAHKDDPATPSPPLVRAGRADIWSTGL